VDLEGTRAALDPLNAKAANHSASNDANQVRHDLNEELISNAELVAAYRTLGLSDQEGLALVARQARLLKDKDPVNAKQTAMRELVRAAQDLKAEGLGVIPGFGTRDPVEELSNQKDASGEQNWTGLDVDKGTDRRLTPQQKVAKQAIRTESAERIQRGMKAIVPNRYRGEGGITYDRLGQEAQQLPESVIARRGDGPDLISLSRAGQRVNTEAKSTNSALYGVWQRLTSAMEQDQSLMTPENMDLVERMEYQLFKGRQESAQRSEVQKLIENVRNNENLEVRAANQDNASALAEITRAADSRMPGIPLLTTGYDNNGNLKTAAPTPSTNAIAFLGEDGAYYDADPGAVGQTIPTARPGNPLSVQTPALPTGTPLQQEILNRLYRESTGGREQVDINLELDEFTRRLYGGNVGGQEVPSRISKWGTLQDAPRTIRGITDLDNALSSVIALGQSQNKAFVQMPESYGEKPVVSQSPGPLEALKALGYTQPETTRLLNAVAQLQMGLNSDSGSADPSVKTPKQTYAETGTGYYRGDQEPIMDAPDVMMEGMRPGRETAPIDNAEVRGLFRGLTGENMSSEDRYNLLPMAQQNLQGLERRSDRSIVRAPIGGISGNQNYRYNRTGISDQNDVEYALTQQALRRQKRIKAAPGKPAPVLTGELKPRDKRNILNAQLTNARAARDANAPKALPPANNRAQRENSFLDMMKDVASKRSQGAEAMEREELRRLITEGRRGQGPGFVKTGDGGMRQVDSSQQYLRPPLASAQFQPQAATSYRQASPAADPVTPQVQQKVSNARATYSLPPSGDRNPFSQQRDRRRRESQFLNGAMTAAPYALAAALGLGTGQAIGSAMQEEVAA